MLTEVIIILLIINLLELSKVIANNYTNHNHNHSHYHNRSTIIKNNEEKINDYFKDVLLVVKFNYQVISYYFYYSNQE